MGEEIELEPIIARLAMRGFTVRPSDARAVAKGSGSTLSDLLDGDLADQLQAFAFLELRRRERAAQPNPARGVYEYRDPAETWAMAEDVDVMLETDQIPRPDPLSGRSS
jgi:hypothetical protein